MYTQTRPRIRDIARAQLLVTGIFERKPSQVCVLKQAVLSGKEANLFLNIYRVNTARCILKYNPCIHLSRQKEAFGSPSAGLLSFNFLTRFTQTPNSNWKRLAQRTLATTQLLLYWFHSHLWFQWCQISSQVFQWSFISPIFHPASRPCQQWQSPCQTEVTQAFYFHSC